VVPGSNAPVSNAWAERTIEGATVVIPPNPPPGGKTDLASVPWPLWWLIASYGSHTRAALLHDALYVDTPNPPVARKTADRLLLSALREPGEKTGIYRHWLMWAAVSAFGTMGRLLGGVFSAHVLAVWVFVVWAAAWEWGPELWQYVWSPSLQPGLAIVVVLAALWMIGFAWRIGVDWPGGWVIPTLVLAAPLVGSIIALWQWPPWSGLSVQAAWPPVTGCSPFTLLVAALVLMLVGPIWGIAVDRKLWGWLWPTALIGFPFAVVPGALTFVTAQIVRVLDFGAAVAARLKGERPATDLDADEQETAPRHIGGVLIPSPTPTTIPRIRRR
jgi:hypothetical protein